MNPRHLLLGLAWAGTLVVALGAGALLFAPDAPSDAHDHSEATGATWTCSMHPQIQRGEPGSCPICGMDLIPATTGGSGAIDHVVLSERAQTLAKLRTTVAKRQADASAQVRLLGQIEPDETTRKNVTTWVGGRIDRLHVNVTGERVRAGQVVATLYSPEVYGAHQDLLTALSQVKRLQNSTESARTAATSALQAARERLRLLGVPDKELGRLEQQAQPTRSVPIRSPYSGTVIERVATEGAYVQTGAPLYRLADLSHLWVQLDAYESDLPRLAVGQPVTLTVEGLPGQNFEGRISFIDPTLDPQRRTSKVRVEVRNRDKQLRPGMFAEAVVSAPTNDNGVSPLVIPVTAPLFTGKRSVVYVQVEAEGELRYYPRTVRLGPRLGEFYPVVAGLSEGERVVSRGAFALDADLQIRGGPSMMAAADDTEEGMWDKIVEISPGERKKLAPVVQDYLALQQALAQDDHPAATKAAAKIEEGADPTLHSPIAQAAWGPIAKKIRLEAKKIRLSRDLEGARGPFEPLSQQIELLLNRFGNPTTLTLHLAFCPMASGNAGATWIQNDSTVHNAYFGAAMQDCGELRAQVSPNAYLASPK